MKQTVCKKFPFRFTPVMLVFFSLGLMLCAAGFALTLWRFLRFLKEGAFGSGAAYGWIQYILLFFVSIFLAALIIAMLISSCYIITEKHLVVRFGFIRQKFAISGIYSVHLFKGMNKLAVYFDDFQTKYTVIVIKDQRYEEFVKALLEQKPTIGFSFSTPEEEEEFKKK